MSNENLMSAREVAKLLGVSVATINRLRKSGKLKALKFNSRMIRYDQKDVAALILSGTT